MRCMNPFRQRRLFSKLGALVLASVVIWIIYWRMSGETKASTVIKLPVDTFWRDHHLHQRADRLPNLAKSSLLKHKRLASYCNNPAKKPVMGEEGEVPRRYKLNSVHMIIRHGTRSPMHIMGDRENKLSCEYDKEAAETNGKLKDFIPTMLNFQGHDHPKSDFKLWALYPSKQVCDMSQLTGQGAMQHIMLGQFLYKRYIEDWELIDQLYYPGELIVKSTQYTRTFQSAISLLYGFLPLFDLKSIPITKYEDTYFAKPSNSDIDWYCPAAERLAGKISEVRFMYRKNDPTYQYVSKEVAKVYGVKQGQVTYISALLDIFMGYVCNNKPLPCNDDTKKCISDMLLLNLWQEMDKEGWLNVNSKKDNECLSRLLVHSLLSEIVERTNNIALNKTNSKFIVYSAHDTTISPLLTVLDVHPGQWPPYASRLIFEHYSFRGLKNSKHFLRVLYNGKDITANIRFCKDQLSSDGLCDIEYFMQFVRVGNLEVFGTTSYTLACR